MSPQARAHNFTLLLSTCSARGPYSELPIHSASESSGTDALCREPGFLLARGRMRWRAGGTCLSEASCAACFPPLAFFRKLRGTAPEPLRPRPKTHRRVPLAKLYFPQTARISRQISSAVFPSVATLTSAAASYFGRRFSIRSSM